MSRSDKSLNDYNTNPASGRFFEWAGEKGKFKRYIKETKETIYIEPPFTFLVLDQLNTVKGYDEANDAGMFANEVRGLKTPITLRTKKGIVKTGLWKDCLENIAGARFTKSVYIAYKEGDSLVIGNLQLNGSALGQLSDKSPKFKTAEDEYLNRIGWFNFTRAYPNIDDIAIQWVGSEWDKKGKTEFYRPVFQKFENISEETLDAALELDKVLQVYLKAYLSHGTHSETEQAQTAAAGWSDGKAGRGDYSEPEGYEPNFSGPPPDLDDEIPF